MEIGFEQEIEVEVVCPKCQHQFTTTVIAAGTMDIDPEPRYNEGYL